MSGKTDPEELKKKVIEALKEVYDPEIPVNIYDLGLVYEVKVTEEGDVYVKMTMTAPACPVASFLVVQAESAIKQIPGVRNVKVDLVFDPPWNPKMISPEGREMLKAMFGYDIVEKWIQQYEAMRGA